MTKGIIIQASSRSKGNTFAMVSYLQEQTGFDVVDLSTKQIGHFDYEFKNQDDDFNALFKNIVTNYDTIILATPIYWYTMSGLLKVFLDRISDFLKIEKDYGRQLRGMQMASLSCSDENEIFDGFTMPFVESAKYLGMFYKGHIHTWLENETISETMKTKIKTFSERIIA
ncbi:flavodoxin family protein [Pontimicrobium sp. MEBiC06410]